MRKDVHFWHNFSYSHTFQGTVNSNYIALYIRSNLDRWAAEGR